MGVANRARLLAAGAAWLFAAGAVGQVAQLGYSTITSRILDPAVFGAYAVALTVLAGIGLFAASGMDEAVARLVVVDRREIRELAGWALGLGLLMGAATALTAPLWAALFAVPAATSVIRVLAIGTALTPYLGLLAGLTRASGRYRQYAVFTTVIGLVCLGIGLLAVMRWSTPATLGVASASSAVLTLAGHRWYVGHWVIPVPGTRRSLAHIRFGAKATTTHLVEYLGLLSCQLGLARGVGQATLGQWNRGVVFATMPIEAVTGPINRVLYPELGQGWDRTQGRDKLLAICQLSSSCGLIGGAAWGALLVTGLPWLLGSQWVQAGWLSAPLAVGAGLSLAWLPLTNALMAGGEFREFARYQPVTTAIFLGSAVATYLTHSPWYVTFAFPLVGLARALLAANACRRVGLLPASGRVFRPQAIGMAVLAGVACGAAGWWGLAAGAGPIRAALALMAIAGLAGAVVIRLARTPEGSQLVSAMRQ